MRGDGSGSGPDPDAVIISKLSPTRHGWKARKHHVSIPSFRGRNGPAPKYLIRRRQGLGNVDSTGARSL